MKPRIILPIALTLALLISFVSFAPTAQAQRTLKPVADTGVITLGPNQILRITRAGTQNEGAFGVQFGRASYMPLGCNGDGVCKYDVASQSLAAPVMVNPGQAASIEITNSNTAVRGIVLSNNPDARITALIINTSTGEVIVVEFVGKGGSTA